MSWAAGYLIKSAVRLGVRLRAGQLSEGALKRLRAAGILRSPQRMQRGLQRGNKALMARYKIEDLEPKKFNALAYRTVAKPGPGFKAHTNALFKIEAPDTERILKELKIDPLNPAQVFAIPFSELQARSAEVAKRLSKPRAAIVRSSLSPMLKQAPDLTKKLKGFKPGEQRALRSLLQRHEIDEVRAMVAAHRRGKGKMIFAPLMNHGKKVLKRERELIQGLPANVRKFMEQLREREFRL